MGEAFVVSDSDTATSIVTALQEVRKLRVACPLLMCGPLCLPEKCEEEGGVGGEPRRLAGAATGAAAWLHPLVPLVCSWLPLPPLPRQELKAALYGRFKTTINLEVGAACVCVYVRVRRCTASPSPECVSLCPRRMSEAHRVLLSPHTQTYTRTKCDRTLSLHHADALLHRTHDLPWQPGEQRSNGFVATSRHNGPRSGRGDCMCVRQKRKVQN